VRSINEKCRQSLRLVNPSPPDRGSIICDHPGLTTMEESYVRSLACLADLFVSRTSQVEQKLLGLRSTSSTEFETCMTQS